jgi:hypothetical protein
MHYLHRHNLNNLRQTGADNKFGGALPQQVLASAANRIHHGSSFREYQYVVFGRVLRMIRV